VIVRLAGHPAGRFLLPVTVTAGTRRVLMRTADRGVHAHHPAALPSSIGVCLQHGQDRRPGAITLPAANPSVQRRPGCILRGHVPPRRPGPHPPADPVDDLPFSPPGRTTPHRRRRQRGRQHRPLRVGEIVPPRRRDAGHEVSGRYAGLLGRYPIYGDLSSYRSPPCRDLNDGQHQVPSTS
jgi:hypothetical protein